MVCDYAPQSLQDEYAYCTPDPAYAGLFAVMLCLDPFRHEKLQGVVTGLPSTLMKPLPDGVLVIVMLNEGTLRIKSPKLRATAETPMIPARA